MDMYLEKMFNFFGSNQEDSWVVYIAVGRDGGPFYESPGIKLLL